MIKFANSRLRARTVGATVVGLVGLGVGAAVLASGGAADATPVDTSCPYGTTSFKIDPVAAGDYASADGTFAVTLDDLQPDADGQFRSFDFTVTQGTALVVFVKGGSGANTYDYRPAGTTSGDDLQAPLNKGGNVAALSNIVFCYGTGPSPSPSASGSPSPSDSPPPSPK